MLQVEYSTTVERRESFQHCISVIAISLFASFALYIIRNLLQLSTLQLCLTIFSVNLLAVALCTLFLWRSANSAKRLTIEDNGRITLDGIGFFKKTKYLDSKNIWKVKIIKRLGEVYLRLDFLQQPPQIFRQRVFENKDAISKIESQLEKFPLAVRGNMGFPWAGCSIALTLLITYLLSRHSLDGNLAFGLISQGGWIRERVLEGELFRFISFGFLHGSYLHVFSNIFALILFSFAVEHITGPIRLFLLFTTSLAISGVAGFTLDSIVLVGASGGIYGLVGLYYWKRFFAKRRYPERFPQFTKLGLLYVLFIDIIVGIMVKQVALPVHLLGFFTGFLYGHIFIGDLEIKRDNSKTEKSLLTVVLCTYIFTTYAVIAWPKSNLALLASNWIDNKNTSPSKVNSAAWYFAVQPHSDLAKLEKAEQRVSSSNMIEAMDTHATLLARLDRLPEAISIENDLVQNHYKAIYVSQLARFELAALSRGNQMDIEPLKIQQDSTVDIVCTKSEKQIFSRLKLNSSSQLTGQCGAAAMKVVGVYPGDIDLKEHKKVILNPQIMTLPL